MLSSFKNSSNKLMHEHTIILQHKLSIQLCIPTEEKA